MNIPEYPIALKGQHSTSSNTLHFLHAGQFVDSRSFYIDPFAT
jgi:hypothetical protein